MLYYPIIMTIEQTLGKTSILKDTYHYLMIQGQEPDIHYQGSHPDAAIRSFNRGLLMFSKENPDFEKNLGDVISKRSDLDATHLTDLLARTTQFILRRQKIFTYVTYTPEKWQEYLSGLNGQDLELFWSTLETRFVATHVPERYRALGALSALLCNRENRAIGVGDFGCSLNLGLPGILTPNYLLGDVGRNGIEFVDETEGKVVKKLLELNNIKFSRALGIDKQDLFTPDGRAWVRACAYFNKYDQNSKTLDENLERLSMYFNGIKTEVGDVTAAGVEQKQLLHLLKGENNESLDIIYTSMMMYQLPEQKRRNVLVNAERVLKEGGMFVELTFDQSENWFLPNNIITTIRFNNGGRLKSPLVWLRWDSSRCSKVIEGNHFDKVNRFLEVSS